MKQYNDNNIRNRKCKINNNSNINININSNDEHDQHGDDDWAFGQQARTRVLGGG